MNTPKKHTEVHRTERLIMKITNKDSAFQVHAVPAGKSILMTWTQQCQLQERLSLPHKPQRKGRPCSQGTLWAQLNRQPPRAAGTCSLLLPTTQAHTTVPG